MKARAKVPAFKSEAQERVFWETQDSTALVDWSKARRVRLPNLKPSDPKHLRAKHLDPIPPGEILREEFMRPLGVSINTLARDLDVLPNRISEIVNGKRTIT